MTMIAIRGSPVTRLSEHEKFHSSIQKHFFSLLVFSQLILFLLGREATFTSFTSGNASVQWLLNGSLIHTLNSSHAETAVDRSGGFTAGTLRLSNLPVTYNSTRITCVATLSSTTPAQVLNATTSLLLQGS